MYYTFLSKHSSKEMLTTHCVVSIYLEEYSAWIAMELGTGNMIMIMSSTESRKLIILPGSRFGINWNLPTLCGKFGQNAAIFMNNFLISVNKNAI